MIAKNLTTIIASLLCSLSLSTFGTESDLQMELYPNPAIDYIELRITSLSIQKVEVQIKSVIGNEVRVASNRISPTQIRINTTNLSEGYYYLIVHVDNNKTKSFRFLKK